MNSIFLDKNNSKEIIQFCNSDTKEPYEGEMFYKHKVLGLVILRFKNGLLDGDYFDKNGIFIKVQPAVEANGHLEFWRNGKLHRDNGEPAIYSDNYNELYFFENGEQK